MAVGDTEFDRFFLFSLFNTKMGDIDFFRLGKKSISPKNDPYFGINQPKGETDREKLTMVSPVSLPVINCSYILAAAKHK